MAFADVTRQTLDRWIKYGYCHPSLLDQKTSGSTRYWSIRDAIIVRVLATIDLRRLDAGALAQLLDDLIPADPADLAPGSGIWFDGRDLFSAFDDGTDIGLLRGKGQATFFREQQLQLREIFEEAEMVAVDMSQIAEDPRLARPNFRPRDNEDVSS